MVKMTFQWKIESWLFLSKKWFFFIQKGHRGVHGSCISDAHILLCRVSFLAILHLSFCTYISPLVPSHNASWEMQSSKETQHTEEMGQEVKLQLPQGTMVIFPNESLSILAEMFKFPAAKQNLFSLGVFAFAMKSWIPPTPQEILLIKSLIFHKQILSLLIFWLVLVCPHYTY